MFLEFTNCVCLFVGYEVWHSIPFLFTVTYGNTKTEKALNKRYAWYCGKWRRNVCGFRYVCEVLLSSFCFDQLQRTISLVKIVMGLEKIQERSTGISVTLSEIWAMGRNLGGRAAPDFAESDRLRQNETACNWPVWASFTSLQSATWWIIDINGHRKCAEKHCSLFAGRVRRGTRIWVMFSFLFPLSSFLNVACFCGRCYAVIIVLVFEVPSFFLFQTNNP